MRIQLCQEMVNHNGTFQVFEHQVAYALSNHSLCFIKVQRFQDFFPAYSLSGSLDFFSSLFLKDLMAVP